MDDSSPAYAEFLRGFRRNLQLPYRWNLNRLNPGYTLDVGCGIGRNLANLEGVGIDPNETCVTIARSFGLKAFTPTDFCAEPETFDSLLFAHVLEHMDRRSAEQLVKQYLPYLRPGGQVILICPQEAGFRSDATHVQFCDFDALRELAMSLGLTVQRSYSFPFARWVGRMFKYNEFVVAAIKEA